MWNGELPPQLTIAPPRRRLRSTLSWIGAFLLLAAAVGAAAGWWWLRDVAGEMSTGSKAPIVAAARSELGVQPTRIATPKIIDEAVGAQTILLLGSDSRGADRGRSDTMILARLDAQGHRISLLSLPRDLWVSIPGHGHAKLNAAYYYGGAALVIAAIRETLGVPVDHFVMIDFSGFQQLIDGVHGVWLPVDQRYLHTNDGASSNNYMSIDIPAGYQRLDGRDALAFARWRHTDSDFVRAARQQLVMRELKKQLVASRRSFDAPALLRIAARTMTSDVDDPAALLQLIRTVMDVPSENIARAAVSGTGSMISGQSAVVASDSQLRLARDTWLAGARATTSAARPESSANRRTGAPIVPATRIAALAADTQSAAIIQSHPSGRLKPCVPSQRPSAGGWDTDSTRSYKLGSQPALAMSWRLGSGKHLLWMQTTWRQPPILAGASGSQRVNGKKLTLYRDSGRLRMVAWATPTGIAWLTNTLQNDVDNATMLALAVGCRS